MTDSNGSSPGAESGNLMWPVFSLWLLWAYVYLALLPALPFLGFSGDIREYVFVLPISLAAFYVAAWVASKKHLVSQKRFGAASMAAIVTLSSVLAIDVAYSVFLNLTSGQDPLNGISEESRQANSEIMTGEYRPRNYYPTDRNFRIFKPGITITTEAYGQLYTNNMKASQALMDAALERERITLSIDKHGFRETTPLAEASIFALGDSFTEGSAVSQENTWVDVLEDRTGLPTYNLGSSDSSPKQQLMLLEYLFEQNSDSIQIETLVWMIFEGNDLEDNYAANRPPKIGRLINNSVLSGSVAELVKIIPGLLRDGSFINRALTGRLVSPVGAAGTNASNNSLVYDGVRLETPLLHSENLGYRFFVERYLERAEQDESYVRNHDNAPRLRQTFSDMMSLADEKGFEVVVVIAPSGPRLYKGQFSGLEGVMDEPYFINMAAEFAQEQGFDVINLYDGLLPHAETELIYARDDSHWNRRGNELAAELIAAGLTRN